MEFRVDEVKRQVILVQGAPRNSEIILNEFDVLNRKFLEGTQDRYECELVLQDVEITNDVGEKTGVTELKAFARRKGVENWLMGFVPEEYIW